MTGIMADWIAPTLGRVLLVSLGALLVGAVWLLTALQQRSKRRRQAESSAAAWEVFWRNTHRLLQAIEDEPMSPCKGMFQSIGDVINETVKDVRIAANPADLFEVFGRKANASTIAAAEAYGIQINPPPMPEPEPGQPYIDLATGLEIVFSIPWGWGTPALVRRPRRRSPSRS